MVEAKIDPDKKIIFFLFFVAIILGIAYTYSYFSSKGSSSEQNITSGTLSIEYIENEEGIINSNNIVPIKDENILTSATKLSFNVSNTGNVDAKFDIKLTDLIIDENLATNEFKWALYNTDNSIASSDFSTALTGEDYLLIEDIDLPIDTNNSYTLYIWISETNEEQNEMSNKTFSSKISIEAT